MAVLGRNDIQQNTNDKLPSNNAKLITAKKHREVLKDFRESFFNLVDDKLKDITYDVQGNNQISLSDYLSTLFQNSVKRIKVGTIDVGDANVGDPLTVTDPDNLVSSAVIQDNGSDDTLIKITWSGSSGINTSKAKIPVIHYQGNNWNANNDVFVVMQDNGGYINVALRQINQEDQAIDVEIIIL